MVVSGVEPTHARAEQNDEWHEAAHRYRSEISPRKIFSQTEEDNPSQIEANTA